MKLIKTKFKDCYLVKPKVFCDQRGFFVESYSAKKLKDMGIDTIFCQDNHSMSVQKGVIRGMHFQFPPHTQAKFVRVTRGAVFDVVIDLRKTSPTFGKWQSYELRADNFFMLYIPQGFAHGFCTLDNNTEVLYKCDKYYMPEFEGGILWNDPDINIKWPVKNPVLSGKDKCASSWKDFESPF